MIGRVIPNGVMFLSLLALGMGIGSSTLTFAWVIEHDVAENFFPEFAGGVIYISDLLVGAGLVGWLVARVLYRNRSLEFGPRFVWVPLVVLVIWSWLSVTWAPDPSMALWSASRRGALFLLYIVIVSEWGRFQWIAIATVLGIALLQSTVSLAQIYEHSAVGLGTLGELEPGAFGYENIGANRAYGLGFNPNPVGVVMAIGSTVAFSLLIARRRGVLATALLGTVLATTLFGVGASGSRSAILAVVAGVGAVSLLELRASSGYFTFIRPYLGHAALLIVIVGSLVMIVSSGQGQKQALGLDRFSPDQLAYGASIRSEDMSLSYPIIRDAPLIGVGTGNYPVVLKTNIAGSNFSPKITPVHNVPLLVLAELGIVGLLAWSAVLFGPFIWFLARMLKRSKLRVKSYLWISAVSVVLVESMFDFTPWATQDGRVVFMAVVALWSGSLDRSDCEGRVARDRG